MSHQVRRPLAGVVSMIGLASMGEIPGYKSMAQFGYNTDVGTSPEDVTCQGGTYVFPSNSGEGIEIVSDNAGDTGIEIIVSGLNENFVEKVETVTLNGTTAVSIPGLWARVFLFRNIDSSAFAGKVSIFDQTTSAKEFACAFASDQESSQSIWTVPAGFVAFIKELISSVNKKSSADVSTVFRVRVRKLGGVFTTRFRVGPGVIGSEISLALPLVGKTDIKIDAESSMSGTDVSAVLSFLYIDQNIVEIVPI